MSMAAVDACDIEWDSLVERDLFLFVVETSELLSVVCPANGYNAAHWDIYPLTGPKAPL